MRYAAGTCVAAILAWATPTHAAGPVIELQAEGVQIYTCTEPSAWRLKAPEATLRTPAGAEAGRHFAGPSWQAPDGSIVKGEPLGASPAPQPGAIPWVILRAASHDGAGAFATVAYIARTHTQGGTAPATGCDAQHAGAEARIPYTATYLLFPSP